MSNKILFIFEGEKTEEHIIANLEKVVFSSEKIAVKCVYGGEIYQLYKAIKDDEDLDTFNLIKERNTKNAAILAHYNRADFAEIYMFFDYDGHSNKADDNKLQELLDFFNEETEKGKLFVSYPMVEALKHICDYETFKELTVECKRNIKYKNIVHNSPIINELSDFTQYDLAIWKKLIETHVKKANFITSDVFELPNHLISQIIIFSKQLEKYIDINQTVAVLSAFPLFLHDYYGNKEIKKRLAK